MIFEFKDDIIINIFEQNIIQSFIRLNKSVDLKIVVS